MRALTLLALTLGCLPAFSQPRQEVSLSGDWEFVRVKDLAAPPPAEGWQPIKVPGTLSGYDYERAWFRRDFTVPESMRGLRLELHFGGVKFNSVVVVNGQKVGGHFGGHEPFDVDITAAAKVGETNRLALGCCDWTGVFSDRETDFSVMQTRAVEVREVPRDKVLAPIGGLVTQYGPWDEVQLRAHSAVFVRDLFIKPSTRKGLLRVEYTLENQSDQDATVSLAPVVLDGDAEALVVPAQSVRVPAGKQATAVAEAPWAAPRTWSPWDPHLYFLRTRVGGGDQPLDELRTRFGFREFWVEGGRFHLNGSHINLLSTSWWPSYGQTKEAIADQITRVKAANCVCFRTHTQPWPELWYETADELGLMMIPEGAVWNDDDAYRVNDQRFWDNYAAHLQAEVGRDRNKPSMVMYSLENEFYGDRVNPANTFAAGQLAHLGELMHQWDPTRPILYESDGDPGGVADVIGIHYPHEYPDVTDWPNTAYWMDKPKSINWAFLPDPWTWDRKKPVYVGEFLWIPSSDPSWDTVFFGDETYEDYQSFHVRAKGESWRMAIQAYRYFEVGGISPWTMIEGGVLDDTNACYAQQKYAMQHIAAYVREYDHNFHSGVQVTRTLDVYNDILDPSNLVLHWALADGDQELTQGQQTLAMQPGERKEVPVSLTMPLAAARRELKLKLEIRRKGELVFQDAKDYSLFAPPSLKAPAVVALFDPSGRTAAALAKCDLKVPAVADLTAIPPDVKVLIIGAGALQGETPGVPVIGAAPAGPQSLMAFVRNGGRALVLEQTEYPAGVIPATLDAAHGSTMTFPQMPSHPLLAGLKAEDLRFWRPDNRITSAEPVRPTSGAFKAIIVSGSSQGINHSPLLELPLGKGTLVLCQMKVSDALGLEPAAGILLQNALDYLAAFKAAPCRTALYCTNAATKDFLDGLGLVYTDVTANPGGTDWGAVDLLIACGPLDSLGPFAEQITSSLPANATILFHRMRPDELATMPELARGLTLTPYKGSATRIRGSHPLAECFANEDLYWLGEQKAASSWATKPLASDMTEFVFAKSLRGKAITTYDAAQMTLAGPYVALNGGLAILPSGASTAAVTVDVPTDGPYILGVVAGGSPAAGTWPAGTVSIDGKQFGSFACQGSEPTTYTMFGSLTAGKHEALIRFTNDAQIGAEDRNLTVKALLLAPDDPPGGPALLTNPPALAVVQTPVGRIVIDQIRWEDTQTNARKAARYVCGLLTGLGAQFSAGAATIIPVGNWVHDPAMHWYRSENGGAYMGDSGYIVGKVQVAKAGHYTLKLIAHGTPVKGIGCILAVEIDGKPMGEIETKSTEPRAYALPVDLAAGEREIKVIFTNDEWAPPEDRNVSVDKIEVSEGK